MSKYKLNVPRIEENIINRIKAIGCPGSAKGGRVQFEQMILEELEGVIEERCQKGYKTHPTRKTKKMFGRTYRNCIKAEGLDEEEVDERRLKPAEKRKLKRLEKEVPKDDFTDRYGKEGESIYYATLTKMAKKDKKK
jgi:hypothetical protein